MQQQAIFLDRDGVINKAVIKDGKPYPPATVADLCIPDDASVALNQLKAAGFLLIGITNQPDVARGTMTRCIVESINIKLMQVLPLTEIKVCYHDNSHQCDCRKPKPGMLLQAAHEYEIDLNRSFMIGDRWKDIEAGQCAGCKTIWIKNNYLEPAPQQAHFIVNSLSEAVRCILELSF